MNKILKANEIKQFQRDGAIFLKNKFDLKWINKLQKGIERDIEKLKLDLWSLFYNKNEGKYQKPIKKSHIANSALSLIPKSTQIKPDKSCNILQT